MADIKITVDAQAIKELGEQVEVAEDVGLRRVLERGEQLLREEIPKQTHNLEQGVSSYVEPRSQKGLLEGFLVVSARRGRTGARQATVHLASGKTKQVSLRPQPAYDYARAVAHGTGIYAIEGYDLMGGEQEGGEIEPRNAKALLIPVSQPPTLNGKPQAYIESEGQIFIVRPYIKGMKPNPYDERAGKRLEAEAPAIFNRAVEDVKANP
jgi:hypothetical protein